MHTVSWTHMGEGTREDYELLTPAFETHARAALVPNLVAMLERLAGPTLGYRIDRFQHSLQSATRAHRNGESVDLVVGALLHDVADSFAPDNHSAAAAALLEPYVDERTRWIVAHHGLFQGYYYFHHHGGNRHARDAHRDSPYYDDCVHFCEHYDANCFDPAYPNLPVGDFVPLLEEVFGRPSRLPSIPEAIDTT